MQMSAASPTLRRDSLVWPATCGVTMRVSTSSRGSWLCGSGFFMSMFSASRTSRAAPPQLPGAQCGDQGLLVDEPAAGGVDQQGPGRICVDGVGVDGVPGGRGERDVQADDVGGGEEFVEVDLAAAGLGDLLRGEVGVGDDDVHPEPVRRFCSTRVPMLPSPYRPRVLPCSSLPTRPALTVDQARPGWRSAAVTTLRASARARAKTCSATAWLLLSGGDGHPHAVRRWRRGCRRCRCRHRAGQ